VADTVNDVKPTVARPPAAFLAVLAVLAGLAAAVGLVGPAALASARRAAVPGAGAARAAVSRAADPASRPVVIIGIPGLRWTDISPAATPELWRLAGEGSVGSLVVTAVQTYTCPADAWLTLNSGQRAMAPRTSGRCRALPAVRAAAAPAGAGPGSGPGRPATVPALTGPRGIEQYNIQFSYGPAWGLLASAARGGCVAAVGPGAALALASRSGAVASYEPRVTSTVGQALARCPLTVADLGALPAATDRAAAVRVADRAAGRIIAAAPAGAIIVVAGLGDDSAPHLRAIIVSGPGYGAGLLTAASTRQPGLVTMTDLAPSVLDWRGRHGAIGRARLGGSEIQSAGRGPLRDTIRTLLGQDTAAQVNRDTSARYFLIYGLGAGIVFGLIWLILRGAAPDRRRRRRAAYRVAAVIVAAGPAGSFLASLLPWPVWPHPALLLYGVGLAWAGVIAAVALAGPWRRAPLGSAGFIGAATIAVIGLDVITGSQLQPETPFGQSALVANRFYGIGNNAIGVYALGGLLCAAWAGDVALRRAQSRGRAVAAAGAVTLFTVIAAAWPHFGAKVGGTIAMVPAFLVLLAAIAGVRITPRRSALVAVSGVLLIAAFAVLNFWFPAATGTSDLGAFVSGVLHGGAGDILRRKIDSNVGSLTENWATPIIPVVVVVTGMMLAWPDRLRLHTAAQAMRAEPLLRPLLMAMWLVGLLGWLADDSGVTVTATALPLALPLVIAIVTGVAEQNAASMSDLGPDARTAPATGRAG
jgi:hypothetical protein